ncbi:MAG: asparaginase, partial [Bacilli bacterium]
KVRIVKSYLGAEGDIIEWLVEQGRVDALVVEGVGRGQVSLDMTNAIKRAVKRGVLVAITTSAEEGRVHDTYDYEGSGNDLKKAGAILATDYDSKKARIKIGLLHALKYDKARIEKLF